MVPKRHPASNLGNLPPKDKSKLEKNNCLQTFEHSFLRRMAFAPYSAYSKTEVNGEKLQRKQFYFNMLESSENQ